MIDDKHVHGSFCRFEAEPELFLKSGEYGWADRGIHRLAIRCGRGRIGCPFKLKIIVALQTGVVHDWAFNNLESLYASCVIDAASPSIVPWLALIPFCGL